MHTPTAFAATKDMCLSAYRVEVTLGFVCKLNRLGEVDTSRLHAMVICSFQMWRLLPCRRASFLHAVVQADIFSYGVVLWEIVTHEQPTRGGVRDCRVPQECPAEIDDLISRCMHADPFQRPTAKEICDAIIRWRVCKELELREARTGRKQSLTIEKEARRNSAEAQRNSAHSQHNFAET